MSKSMLVAALLGLVACTQQGLAEDPSADGEVTDQATALPPPESIFATVNDPNQWIESVAIHGDDVYTGGVQVGADAGGPGDGLPSKVFRYNRRTGVLRQTMTITGEDPARFHGMLGMATDAEGRLYVADTQGRVLRLDFARNTQETYATLPNLTPCGTAPAPGCSVAELGGADLPALANDLTFDARGNLYVTDTFQNVIWRVRPGTGTRTPELWFQDARFAGDFFGVNGVRVTGNNKLVFVTTADSTFHYVARQLPLKDHPAAADLVEIGRWPNSETPEIGADGIEVGQSGTLYITTLEGKEILAVHRDGTEERIQSPLFSVLSALSFEADRRSAIVVNIGDTRRLVRVPIRDRSVARHPRIP